LRRVSCCLHVFFCASTELNAAQHQCLLRQTNRGSAHHLDGMTATSRSFLLVLPSCDMRLCASLRAAAGAAISDKRRVPLAARIMNKTKQRRGSAATRRRHARAANVGGTRQAAITRGTAVGIVNGYSGTGVANVAERGVNVAGGGGMA